MRVKNKISSQKSKKNMVCVITDFCVDAWPHGAMAPTRGVVLRHMYKKSLLLLRSKYSDVLLSLNLDIN